MKAGYVVVPLRLVLLLIVLVGVVAGPEGVDLTEEQHLNLPDFSDPEVAKRLKCSACRASAVEMHEALAGLRKKRGKAKIKEYEYTEVMDAVCDGPVRTGYGIQLKNNLPTNKFSKDDLISRAKGNWGSRYLSGICGDIYRDHEDDLMEHQREPLLDYVGLICKDAVKLCDAQTLEDKALGDERGFEYDSNGTGGQAPALNVEVEL
uniref:DUF3456 domain-containing protein n=1 Tax=Hemiselmis andersenii TaxID=464988 RepID=A0A6U2FLR5_HEMAN|mmetsp:Transcript_32603/g.76136  ORF Transcript_32603/g.76136 Transcript_32603/m.76136 type:complete len:206 (-) Transcript_32603:301-918(-)|eukprot:CAMPEP_0114150884 /NCGR_PEP_ID=MMETSP0043_2-20121206/22961_1 /TAXON_ID=464988 /ORGANISM="Hemiselmis andersenii, Strain CCMP644" /LENGTH=205 /DNA_ID=CAMNT_0001245685 /DNA_START=106 /DNA_END=723 /DNA_ORIENTATION=+